MEIKMKNLYTCIVVYMYLAVAVFFLKWLRPVYAVLSCIAMCIGLFHGIRAWRQEEEGEIHIQTGTMVIGLAAILFLCWHTGIGAFAAQTGDWHKHNAVLHDLIEKRWPVIYSTEYGDSMLSYYIGFYMLPAAVGKITGSFRLAEFTEFLWSAAGLWMTWLLLIRLCRADGKKRQLLALGLMFFYGGMMALGQAVCGKLYPENYPYGSNEWMNPETVVVQYTSNWFLLKWVPSQTIVPWMATALTLLKKHKVETYVMIGLPLLLYSGFTMAGIAVIMAFLAAESIYRDRKGAVRRIFSLSNIILAVFIGGVLLLYFWGNISGEKPEFLNFHLLRYGSKKLFYFIFCFFMFGYYGILMLRENRKNAVYWITVISLCIYPLFSMGLYNDFTMRASIPALFSMTILILQFLFGNPYQKGEERYYGLVARKTLLAAGLAVGMIYPLLNICVGIATNKVGGLYRIDDFRTLEGYADPSAYWVPDDLKYNYYSYDLEHDIFYQYLAR